MPPCSYAMRSQRADPALKSVVSNELFEIMEGINRVSMPCSPACQALFVSTSINTRNFQAGYSETDAL